MTTETTEIALLKKRIAELEAALHAGVDGDDACPPRHYRFLDADRQGEEAGAKNCPVGVFPASETTLQAILNAAPEPILLMDTNGIVLAANNALAQRFQTPLKEIIGTDPYRLIPPELAAGRRQHVEKAIAGGQPLHFQDERLGRTYEHYLYPLKDAGGSVTQLAIYTLEITEQATAVKALRHRKALLNATEKLAHVGGWEWDIARQSLIWTQETYRIHGLPPKPHACESSVLVEKSLSCYDPADRPVIRAAFRRCVEQGEPYDLEFPFTSVQGQRMWIRTLGKAVRREGRIALVRGNIVDITQERQKAELLKARLRISEAAGSLDLQKLMRMILDETEKLTGSHIGFFHFYDAKRKSISLQAWSTATAQTFCAVQSMPWHYDLEKAGVWADCIRQNRPVIHNNYNELPHRKGMPAGHAPVVRELVVPVKRNKEIVAILGIGNKAHDYDQKDVELVTALANLAYDTVLQKQAETALRESEEKYRSLFSLLRSMCDNVSDMIWAKDREKRYIFANKALCRGLLNAADTLEPLGKTDLYFATRERGRHPDNPAWHTFGELCQDSDQITMDANGPRQFDEFGNVQGEFLYLDVHKAPFIDETGTAIGTVGSARDITEHKRAEEALRNSLAEKEVLLREVHHRVKNNMAAIIGLFDLQRQAMDDPGAKTVLAELSSRVRAMSLVHEKLYRSESLTKINFQEYIESLISHLRTSFGSPAIRCDIKAGEVAMPLDLAVPCGMIINELVTNSLKYAFPEGKASQPEQSCRIFVSLDRSDYTFTLTVADNGVGLPPQFDWTAARSLGLVLVRMLGQHQLGGRYQLDCGSGTRFTLTFSLANGRRSHG